MTIILLDDTLLLRYQILFSYSLFSAIESFSPAFKGKKKQTVPSPRGCFSGTRKSAVLCMGNPSVALIRLPPINEYFVHDEWQMKICNPRFRILVLEETVPGSSAV